MISLSKIRYKFTFVFCMMLLLMGYGSVSAQTDNRSAQQQIEHYLNSITTLKARFTQTAYDGSEAQGTFFLNRPGRLRFEYDAPIKDFIVADGVFIYYYDAELKQQSNTTIGNSLAGFLLRKTISLSDDIAVQAIGHTGQLLTATLAMRDDPGAGSLTLGFSENPLKLEKWRVTDSQGLITEVALDDVETGLKLPRKLFYYLDPEHGKPQYN